MNSVNIVSRKEWLAARKEHLTREKEFTRLRDQLSQQRRELPWVKVDKAYLFDGPNGQETLADLFEGKSQLIVYHMDLTPKGRNEDQLPYSMAWPRRRDQYED